MVALPDIGPAIATGVFESASLEAVRLTGRVGLCWRRFAEHPAQVYKVFLRRGALLQLGCIPLGDKLVRCHGRVQSGSRR